MITKRFEKIIQYTCFLVLLARAVQHLFFDSPIRGILYSPLMMKPILQFFNISFNDYINSSSLDNNVNLFLNGFGVLLFISAILFMFYHLTNKTVQKIIIYTASFLLTIIAFAYFKDKSFSIGQFLEYSSQMFLPLFFIIKKQMTQRKTTISRIRRNKHI